MFLAVKKRKYKKKKQTVSKLDTVSKNIVVKGIVAHKLNDTVNDSIKITLETLKKGSKKVFIDGKFYYKNNSGDYEIETRPEGKDTLHVYYDVVKQKDYDIKTKKLISINLGEQWKQIKTVIKIKSLFSFYKF